MTEQETLAAQILDGYTPVGDVPDDFAEHVLESIARRPSPTPPPDPLQAIHDKLDAILDLLRGTPE